MPDIFLSYTRDDQATARNFAEALAAEGFSVWWDVTLRSGEAYDRVTEKALKEARAVVVLWSKKSVESRWVRAEATLADRNKTLLPAMIEICERPIMFELTQAADLCHWAGNRADKVWLAFVADVKRFVAGEDAGHVDEAVPRANITGEPHRPCICVLPFANMSDDPQQEYFSDGISEDIITDLSKVSALSVISRNSAFTYKGRHVDLPRVARELGVSHILEGSVRKSGGRLRITAQLIDGVTNKHLWAERYDRDLNDIFALQDEISEAIVAALKLKLLPEEKSAIQQRGTNNIDAYNLYLMARQIYLAGNSATSRGNEAVVRHCAGAIKIDENYARAWALMALAQVLQFNNGGSKDSGLAAAERALVLDGSLAEAHVARARALINLEDFDAAGDELKTALRLDPDSYEANVSAGLLCRRQNKLTEAIFYFEKGAVLNKDSYFNLGRLTSIYVEIGNSEGARRTAKLALESTERALTQEPDNGMVMGHMAYALAVLGEREHVARLVVRGISLEPRNNQMKVYFARAFLQLDDMEAALDLLDDTMKTGGRFYLTILSAPYYDPLRNHPRFKAMIAAAEARLAAEDAAARSPPAIRN